MARALARRLVKRWANVHRPGPRKNVIVLAMPRGGSTWLMEMICSQPGFRYVSEPFDLRKPPLAAALGFESWHDLYQLKNRERVREYLHGLNAGRITVANPHPGRPLYRPWTNRTVFKLIHGGEDQVAWMPEGLKSHVLVLLRHPIANALARRKFPRLESFVGSDYSRHFGKGELSEARRVLASGSHLEKGVLSWCFQSALPLRTTGHSVTVVTYEQLVLEPERVITHIAPLIEATHPDRMSRRIEIPSSTTHLSTAESRRALKSSDRESIVAKWRKAAGEEEERRAFGILEAFGLDAFRPGELVSHRYWIEASHEHDHATVSNDSGARSSQ